MNEKELKIINHFGLRNQLKKLNEECYELIEAITDYEDDYARNGTKENIIEEMADVMVLLRQFQGHYNITDIDIAFKMLYKTNRTIERIENGYYEK